MKKKLVLVKLDSNYCDYLRNFDDKVPYNYGNKENRPFIGVLFEVGDCKYFAPLSSPKPKHLKLKTKIDFLKIDDGKLGGINFNNMLPVTDKNIIAINLNEKRYDVKDTKYIKLLKEQLYWLNRNPEKLYKKSKTLYDKYVNKTLNYTVLKRCCNFKLLEEKCNEYNNCTLK